VKICNTVLKLHHYPEAI